MGDDSSSGAGSMGDDLGSGTGSMVTMTQV